MNDLYTLFEDDIEEEEPWDSDLDDEDPMDDFDKGSTTGNASPYGTQLGFLSATSGGGAVSESEEMSLFDKFRYLQEAHNRKEYHAEVRAAAKEREREDKNFELHQRWRMDKLNSSIQKKRTMNGMVQVGPDVSSVTPVMAVHQNMALVFRDFDKLVDQTGDGRYKAAKKTLEEMDKIARKSDDEMKRYNMAYVQYLKEYNRTMDNLPRQEEALLQWSNKFGKRSKNMLKSVINAFKSQDKDKMSAELKNARAFLSGSTKELTKASVNTAKTVIDDGKDYAKSTARGAKEIGKSFKKWAKDKTITDKKMTKELMEKNKKETAKTATVKESANLSIIDKILLHQELKSRD